MVLTGIVALIDVRSLALQLADSHPPTVLDVRWRLGGPPGREEYAAGHIPGAVFLDLDAVLCGQPGAGGRHPLPEVATLQAAMRGLGVRTGHPVVVYDAGDGQAAARAWWTLRWGGHEAVSVLDGGFAAWAAEGRPITDEAVTPPPGDVVIQPGQLPVLDADAAAHAAASGTLIDARVAPRYLGETEPVDPVAGHIPGAVNVPAARLVEESGRLRSVAELRSVFRESGVRAGAPLGAYCGSGVTAAQTVLALHEAGYTDAALYVGSWSHWITDPTRPVATGVEPR
jgi:thiosulfate/3-mercaptopyruvate sulfurtransferase